MNKQNDFFSNFWALVFLSTSIIKVKFQLFCFDDLSGSSVSSCNCSWGIYSLHLSWFCCHKMKYWDDLLYMGNNFFINFVNRCNIKSKRATQFCINILQFFHQPVKKTSVQVWNKNIPNNISFILNCHPVLLETSVSSFTVFGCLVYGVDYVILFVTGQKEELLGRVFV